MRMGCLCEVVGSVNDSVKAGVKLHAAVLHVTGRCACERDVHVHVSPMTGSCHAASDKSTFLIFSDTKQTKSFFGAPPLRTPHRHLTTCHQMLTLYQEHFILPFRLTPS